MNSAAAKAFSADLDGWLKQFKLDADKGVRALAMRMAENIIRRTPVDTGYLRNNWYPSLNAADVPPPGKAGVDAEARMAQVFSLGKAGDIFYLSNGVPYAVYVEYGTSRMAPRAMVATTLAEMQTFLQQFASGGGNE